MKGLSFKINFFNSKYERRVNRYKDLNERFCPSQPVKISCNNYGDGDVRFENDKFILEMRLNVFDDVQWEFILFDKDYERKMD